MKKQSRNVRRAVVGQDTSAPRLDPTSFAARTNGGNGGGGGPGGGGDGGGGGGGGGKGPCFRVDVVLPGGQIQTVECCSLEDICGQVAILNGKRCVIHRDPRGGVACPIPCPDWWDPSMASVCGPGNIPICNFSFGTCVDIPAEAAGVNGTATMTFDPDDMNADVMQPLGAIFHAFDPTSPAADMTAAIELTEISRKGFDYLGGAPLNLVFVSARAENALVLSDFPEIRDGGTGLDLDLENVTATALRVCAVLFGFAKR